MNSIHHHWVVQVTVSTPMHSRYDSLSPYGPRTPSPLTNLHSTVDWNGHRRDSSPQVRRRSNRQHVQSLNQILWLLDSYSMDKVGVQIAKSGNKKYTAYTDGTLCLCDSLDPQRFNEVWRYFGFTYNCFRGMPSKSKPKKTGMLTWTVCRIV